jgi:molybdopterin adenylyltransferase
MHLNVGIVTVSDRVSQGVREDHSGPALENIVLKQGWQVIRKTVVPDDLLPLRDLLISWADSEHMDVILTTGGTGFSPRDITPEATQATIQKTAPGIVEAMRAAALKVTPHSMLSRAVAGIRNASLIINLPGSPKGAVENFQVVLPVLEHAVALLRQDPAAEAGHKAVRR